MLLHYRHQRFTSAERDEDEERQTGEIRQRTTTPIDGSGATERPQQGPAGARSQN